MEFELPGDCPSGENCPVHFRLDREARNDALESYSAVTYIGDWCVLTGDNPKYLTPAGFIEMTRYVLTNGCMPNDLYMTSVFKVGEGTLYDLAANGRSLATEVEYKSSTYQGAISTHQLTVELSK